MFEQFVGKPREVQKVVNALPARDWPMRRRIPARARIVWEKDGEEWVDGNALRRDERTGGIFVEFSDPRTMFTGVWLAPDDVEWEGTPGRQKH
ncbi:hypothetical protein M3G43_16210 [Brevibacterium casei]|uniref:hypothetical protein n=1 Tax=Brevibacterium casei TaxID=33889 RepID=UPI00223A91F6|nr:hypothetical protein [Brevibacterium casei]MCT1448798.1 hypothetical protein [Brevibacterium casei]